ncbi:MAG: hypothetical protein JJ895_01030 [Balneolaceae bacterium]|nr:hypothetical protein [Balneolaceae bacterium]
MDLGIVTSYIIAGILIIIILTVGYNVNFSGNELTLHESQKIKIDAVIDAVSYDLPKIGYNQNNRPDTMLVYADSTMLQFYSNIDNSNDESLELITWQFSTDPITATDNPNDFYLYRTIDGTSITMGVGITDFTINYYDELGSTTPLTLPISAIGNKSKIDSIVQLELIIESQSPVALQYSSETTPRYITTTWTKRFSPSNLNLN